jgi:hypothetical protein
MATLNYKLDVCRTTDGTQRNNAPKIKIVYAVICKSQFVILFYLIAFSNLDISICACILLWKPCMTFVFRHLFALCGV